MRHLALPRLTTTALAVSLALALGACGGGGGDDAAALAAPGGATPIVDAATLETVLAAGDDGRPAAAATSEELRATAAEHAALGVETNLDAIGAIGGDARSMFDRASTLARGRPVFDDGAAGNAGEGGAAVVLLDALESADDEAGSLLRAALGLDGEAARATRDGDSFAIDPDDDALCAALQGDVRDDEDGRICRELASRISVRLDAASAERGWLSIDFDGAETLRLGYGPVNSAIELELAAFGAFARAGAELAGEPVGTERFAGRVRLTFGVSERAAGAERATMAVDVLEPLSFEDGAGNALSLAASRVLELAADAATSRLDVAVGLGALRNTSVDEWSGERTTLRLAALTARATLDTVAETLVVDGLGIGRAPMTVSIDGSEVQRFELGDVGFRLDGASGRLSLHGDLAAAYVLRQAFEGGTVGLTARLSAPDGTAVEEAGEGFRVTAGGVDASVVATGSDGGFDESLSVDAGQCAGPDPEGLAHLLPIVVPCP